MVSPSPIPPRWDQDPNAGSAQVTHGPEPRCSGHPDPRCPWTDTRVLRSKYQASRGPTRTPLRLAHTSPRTGAQRYGTDGCRSGQERIHGPQDGQPPSRRMTACGFTTRLALMPVVDGQPCSGNIFPHNRVLGPGPQCFYHSSPRTGGKGLGTAGPTLPVDRHTGAAISIVEPSEIRHGHRCG